MPSFPTNTSRSVFETRPHTQAYDPRQTCVHDLFEARVELTPDAVAVICEGKTLTYWELNRRANQLAHTLRRLGVGPEVLVGICVERSLEMIVGILGILKAGGAYVPLDLAYPRERLAFMLADAHISLLLAQAQGTAEALGPEASVVCLDTDWPSIAQQPAGNPTCGASADNLAYLIYTSGSTREPKGVMITHANLCHFVEFVRSSPIGVTAEDICLHTASITYALSVRQWAIPLCEGATMVLATSEQARNPLALFELIKRERVTVMDVVPSYWRACVQALAGLTPEARTALLDNQLRRIVSIGEPLPSSIPREWAFGFKHSAQLVNIFGQTETTGVVAAYPIPTGYAEPNAIVPIGHSIAGVHIHIVDSTVQPAPRGTPGELCISSPTLARGYLNRAALTAEKLVPNPFSAEPGARLYRTGDFARHLPDGNIEFLGRADQQVKIRGIRVELGEIEGALSEHPAVRECAAVVREETSGEKQLVAYVVPAPGQPPTVSDLHSFLDEKIPDYAVPSVFVFLDALPLTPNGKVNRRMLPDPFGTTPEPAPDQGTPTPSPHQTDVSNWFYTPSWERSSPPLPPTDQAHPKMGWLVFLDTCGLGAQIVKRLEQQGQDVTAVTTGESFARLGERSYGINPRQQGDYDALFDALRASGALPHTILHLWSVTPNDGATLDPVSAERAQDAGFYSLWFLAHALGNQNLTDSVQLGVVTNNMQEVTGEETLCPEKATVLGPCKVIPLEYPNIACHSIDMVLPAPGTPQESRLVEWLIAELAVKSPDPVVAYRGSYRWVQTYKATQLAEGTQEVAPLREGGVYLITGGLGGIGLEVAEYLARTVRARLILTGRSAFPEPHEWESWLATHDGQDGTSRRIRNLQRIEELGAQVLVVRADATDEEQMRAVLARAGERFGEIHGVFHSAGIRDSFHPIRQSTPEAVQGVLAPKVTGTLVLTDVLKHARLDFMVLFSSISSVLGLLGQADYCAANAFLDAFAYWRNRDGRFTVSIDWDSWQEVGRVADAATSSESQILRVREGRAAKGILPAEGMEALHRILRSTLPRVVVSTEDLRARFEQREVSLKEAEQASRSRPKRQRPALENAFVPPSTPTEQLIAGIWQEILGLDRVGLHDNFFELGGDSIRAAMVVNRLQERLGGFIYVIAVFHAPTVAGLAAYLGEHYPEAVAKLMSQESGPVTASQSERVDAAAVALFRHLIPPLAPMSGPPGPKNRPMVFILSPQRSGSTLLRVMLGGHPRLFSPPQLELLGFNTLADRRTAFSGPYSFWREGTTRAIMQIKRCNAEEVESLVRGLEDQQLTVHQFYHLLQEWIGDKVLVDKSPSYALDLQNLQRAEACFEEPLYIHLLRHPYAMIRSFEEAKIEQLFRYRFPFSRRQLAELIWLVSHQNILEFLKAIPQQRQRRVRFEDLVSQPQATMEDICRFLGLEFDPDMLQPYKEQQQRMTDGIRPLSRMVGDIKFHEHAGIEPETAARWREQYQVDFLGDVTWQVAESLGYQRIQSRQKGKGSGPIISTSRGQARELLVQVDRLSDEQVESLLSAMSNREGNHE